MADFYTLSFTTNEVKLLTDSAHPAGSFALVPAGDFVIGASSGMGSSDGVPLPFPSAQLPPFVLFVSSPDEVYVRNVSGGSTTLKVLYNR